MATQGIQNDLDMVTQFESHLEQWDSKSWEGECAMGNWAKSPDVRFWVFQHAQVDIEDLALSRKDYFMAPLWVAYHKACQALQQIGKYENKFAKRMDRA